MLNDNQYKSIEPYRAKIKKVAEGGSISDTEPFAACMQIHKELHMEPFNQYCGTCVATFYIDIFNLMKEYESAFGIEH